MSYAQIVKPNLAVVGRIEWCLSYAKSVFGAPSMYDCAWDAWKDSKYSHNNRDLPKDAAVLMWYSYWATLTFNGKTETKDWGHVTVNVPGKGIYSSPYSSATGHNVLSSIADVERHYGVKYVGWSEDINSLRVAKPSTSSTVDDMKIDRGTAIRILRLKYHVGTPTEDQIKKVTGQDIGEYLDAWREWPQYLAEVELIKNGGVPPEATTLNPGLYKVEG